MQTWKKINEKLVVDIPRLKGVIKTFQIEDGEEREYTVIKGRNNVIALCLTEDNKFIVLEQFRIGAEQVLIDLPSGGIDGDETPEQAAVRELEEETGYTSTDVRLIGKCFSAPNNEGIYYFVIAKNCKKISKPGESEKQLGEIKEISMEELKKYLLSGQLTSADLSGGLLGLFYIENNL